MPFAVILDTCVLYPAHLRDTLLRLAEQDLYQALWSADIIEELRRNLVEEGFDRESVDRLCAEMQGAFPDAEVSGYQPLLGSMTCDPKDRHVLAAAVRSNAAAIVTFNLDDFPDSSVAPYEIDVIHPDRFLLDLLDLAPSTVIAELERQAAANRREPRTLSGLLDALGRAGVPLFGDEVRGRPR
ncbi:MAG: PIN domain-containing protein [Chloroflexi bacterium]|nr:PIN domain-containing protein [Chloroflexota bacterium]MYB83306.1 PIN domain-containing protein [Chloroflexota bacterium]